MRFYKAVFKLVKQHANFDDSEGDDLLQELKTKYDAQKKTMTRKVEDNEFAQRENLAHTHDKGWTKKVMQKLNIGEQFVKVAEHPYARLFFASAYVYLNPRIRDYVAGIGEDSEKSREDDMMEDIEMVRTLRAMRRNKRP